MESIYSSTAKKILKANNLVGVPASKKRKGPFISKWSKYTKDNPSKEVLNSWAEKYSSYNITLCMGKVTGIVGVDIDFKECEFPDEYKQIMELIPKNAVVKKGSKGFTAFLKYNGEEKKKYYHSNSKSIAVEILSDGNTSDIPPSIHPKTKKPYVYISDRTLEDNGVLDDLPLIPPELMSLLEELFSESKPKSCSANVGRAEKLKQMAISALSKGKDIKKVAIEVFKYDQKHHDQPYFSDETEFGKDHKRPKKNVLKFVKSISKSLDEIGNYTGIKVLSISEIMAEAKVNREWLVENLLPSSGSSVLVAAPKAGKSLLSRYLAKCILEGERFLGRSVKKGNVVLGVFEESPINIVPSLIKLGVDCADDNLSMITPSEGLNPFKSVMKYIEENRPLLVIIDTLQTFARIKNINDYSEITPILNQLGEAARKANCHIMYIHHSKKGGDGSSDSVLGSQAIFAGVDTLIQIHSKQGSEKQFLTTTQRYTDADFREAVLVRNKDLSFSVFKDLEDYNLKCAMKKIYKLLKSGEQTESEIVESVPGKTVVVKTAIRKLFDSKKISRKGEGKRNDPYYYYVSSKSKK